MKSGYILALLTASMWGIVPVMEKVGLNISTSRLSLIIYRSLVVGILAFLLIPWSKFLAEIREIPLKSILLIGGSGIIAGFLAMWVYYSALSRAPASVVVPLASTYPLFTLIYSFLILGEKPDPLKVIGAFLIVTGISLLSFRS